MQNTSSRLSLSGASFVIVLLIGLTLAVTQRDLSAEPRQVSDKSEQSKSAPPNRLFELRIYTAAPGKLEALHQRFRDHTLRLFEKHGIKSIGYWTNADEHEAKRLYYLVAYPDHASRNQMLIHGIAADPEFLQAVAESEKDGKLTTKIESVLLTPTDYSDLK